MEKLNENEKKVLEALVDAYSSDGESGYFAFAGLEKKTGLERRIVRLACRSLARKGYTEYQKALWSEDGPAGAGYGATEKGAALINPCDICEQRAVFDYEIDDRGLSPWDKGFSKENSRRIRECDDHYKKSAEQKKLL